MNASQQCRSVLFIVGIIIPTAAIPSPVQTGEGTVSGVVANRATGEPIANATVRLCGARMKKAISICSPTSSGATGRFIFTHRRPGQYRIDGDAPGFLHDAIVLDGKGKSEFSLGSGEQRTVRLLLQPEGTLRGRVVNESGLPIRDVSVAAVGEAFAFGKRSLLRYQYQGGPSEALTDEDGRYRIGSLKPGNYFIEAFAGFPNKPSSAILSRGYLPVFYPNAAFLAEARSECAGVGKEVEIDFRLVPRDTFYARSTLEIPGGFKRDFEPIGGLWREDGQVDSSWENEYDHRTRVFTAGPLAPGLYDLEVKTGIYDTDLIGRHRFKIVDHDPETFSLSMRKPFTLRAKVKYPNDFRMRTRYSTLLRLQPDYEPIDSALESGLPIPRNGYLNMVVRPGRFKLFLFSDDGVYIKSALFQDQDVLASGSLTLGDGSSDALEVTLEHAVGAVRGTVIANSDRSVPGADVKLIVTGEDSPYVLRSVVADSKGEFLFSGVPPGNYYLLALRDAVRDWEFGPMEWAQFEKAARRITVGDSVSELVRLDLAAPDYQVPACAILR